jgi:hypothetical protein
VGGGQLTAGVESGQWTVNSGQAVDTGQLTVEVDTLGNGQVTVGSGQ